MFSDNLFSCRLELRDQYHDIHNTYTRGYILQGKINFLNHCDTETNEEKILIYLRMIILVFIL